MSKAIKLTKDPIWELLRKVTIPASVGSLFQTFYNLVDTWFAGRISAEAIGAIAKSFPIYFVIIAVGVGIGAATNSCIGNLLGAKKINKASLFIAQSVIFALVTSVVVTLFGLNASDFLLGVMGSDAAGIALVSSSGSLRAYYVTGALFASTATGVVKPRQWNHLVFCRISGILKGYLNGKEVFSVNDTTNLSGSSNTVYIGNNAAASSALNGYYSSVRMTNKGVYTGEFTPPTTPLSTTQSSGTNISAVASGECKLLVKGTDASIIDKSQNGNLELNGNVTGSTTQVKFANTKSTYFPGSLGDQIIATSGENVDLSSADPFTWEAWCYFNSVSGVIHLMASEDAGYTQDRIAFELRNSKLSAMFGGTVIQSGSQVLSTGQWYHLAISRAVGSPYPTTRFFVNGNLDQTSSGWQQAVAIGNFDKWYIGSPTTNNISNNYNEFNGYMQDVRFTEGLTRYTANFTPPTEELRG